MGGRQAPHIPDEEPPIHHLSDHEFIAELRQIDGTPDEILQNNELMELMVPLLKADFELFETWQPQQRSPLTIPIIATGGVSEFEGRREEVESWKEHTTAQCKVHFLPGDHFYIHQSEPQLLQLLARYLV